MISQNQELTFNTLKLKFEEKGLNFSDFKMTTSGFINSQNKQYTNLAFWFSDQYDIATKMAVYQGLDRSVFRSKKEYDGSIIRQIDKALEYLIFVMKLGLLLMEDQREKKYLLIVQYQQKKQY